MANNGQLTYQLYKWLSSLDIIPSTQKYKSSGNFSLDSRIQDELLSGYLIGKLLVTLGQEKRITLNLPLISSIKNSNTPAAKVYNWNILNDGFQKFGVNLAKQNQKEITSGNFDVLVQFLIEVHSKTSVKIDKATTPKNFQKGFDLRKISSFEEIKNSENLLEFIIIALSNFLNLSPKQAVSTLGQSAKYLAHMIVKGIKGSYDQIFDFLGFLRQEIPHIVYLAEQDPQKNYQFFLQILKPTLISRQPEVAKKGSQLFESFIDESLKYNNKNLVYQLLSKEGQPFDFIYMGLKRHPYLNHQIWNFLCLVISQALNNFFQIQLKMTINNEQEYLRTFLILLEPMLEDRETRKRLIQLNFIQKQQKKFQNLLNSKLKSKEQTAINEETKLLYLQILSEMWKSFYEDLDKDEAEEILILLVEQLKKNTRLEMYTIRIPSLYRIFNFLEFLAEKKNKLAAIIYKKIIFLFIQNHQSSEIREIVLQNFILLLKKFTTIPLEFLLEPFLKQIAAKAGSTYFINLFDFQFVLEACKHPKMEDYIAIDFFIFFVKFYVNEIIFSQLSMRIIDVIASRYCESAQLREQFVKNTEKNLNLYGMLTFGKDKSYKNERHKKKEDKIINNQKKSLIIELIKYYISLQHLQLTKQVKDRVTAIYLYWYEERNHQDKGLASILQMFGNVEEICLLYKAENLQSQRTIEEEGSPVRGEKSEIKINSLEVLEENKSDSWMQNYGIGYKKKKPTTLITKRNLKPDPKVLEDLEKIKQKWKLQNSRAKLQVQELKKDKYKLNQKELLQRNISLGYNKLPNFSDEKILFQFDSVKTKHLKVGFEFIDIEAEEKREGESIENIMQRYSKYIKLLFRKYAYASVSNSKSGGIGHNPFSHEELILSFTEIMKMLKEKGLLNKIPKITINEILTTINHKKRKDKNILGGIYEADFPIFIVYLTDLHLQTEKGHQKDEPFGMKVEHMIRKLVEDEKMARQLFDFRVLKLKENLQKDENTQIPEGYKKFDEVQINLEYKLKQDTGIDDSFNTCFEIVDWIFASALKIHTIAPITNYIEKKNIVIMSKVPRVKLSHQITDKNMKRPVTGEFQEEQSKQEKKLSKKYSVHKNLDPQKKSRSQRLIKSQNKTESSIKRQEQLMEKQKKRQLHAQKLKDDILRLKQQKQKKQAEQMEKQMELERRRKEKQANHKKYLEQNKKRIDQAKEKQKEEEKKNSRKEKQEKQKKKNDIKIKQAEYLEKEKKIIQQKFQKLQKKKKQDEEKQKEREKFLNSRPPDEVMKKNKDQAEEERIRDAQIKNSIKKGELKGAIEEYNKEIQELFEAYWQWKKQKMDLKGVVSILKDFEITPEYVYPKSIPEVYKSVSKGQMIDYNGFVEILTKLAFRSEKVKEQTKKDEKKEEESAKLDKKQLIYFFSLLKMKQQIPYREIIKKRKAQLG